jgi:hypothetical protein
MQVDHIGPSPTLEHLLRSLHRDAAIAGHSFAMKGRLCQSTLAPPKLTVACHEAIAHDAAHPRHAQNGWLDEIGVVAYQDGFNVIRVGQEIEGTKKVRNTNNLSIIAGASRDEAQRVTNKGAHVSQQKFPGRPRGTMPCIPRPGIFLLIFIHIYEYAHIY